MRLTLRYLGVPVKGSTYLFGDNQSVITSSTIPHSPLSKRHNALSYHRVREAIAGKIIKFFHIDGKINPADMLSKHCGHPQMWPHTRPLLFYSGDTSEIKDLQDKPAVARADSGAHNKGKPEAVKANKFKRTLKPFLL